MGDKKIEIQLFSNSLGNEELEAVSKVFDSKWLGPGNETLLFEEELGKKVKSLKTLVTESCTSSTYLALRTLNIGKGDEVILPSIHFIGVANSIIELGAKPVFADVDLKTLNLLPSEIERLKNDKTKAVVVLHYGGHPCEMDNILKICKRNNLKIIEDSANSPFSKYKGKYCGTIGDIGCVSFDAMKILVTGLGGAMFIQNESFYEKAKELRYFGLVNKKQSGIDSLKDGKTEKWWELDINEISGRYVSSDILSAIGRIQLKKVDEFIKRRKEIWKMYQEGLNDLDWLDTPPEPLEGTESSYYLYWINVKNGKRNELAKYLVDNGIYCSFRYYPLHCVKKYNSENKLPNSEKINKNVLNIPLHQNISNEQVKKIIKLIKEFNAKKTILITGGAGYVGYTLIKEILKKFQNSEIVIYDNFSKGRLENIGQLKVKYPRIEIIPWEKADIRDYNNFEDALKKYNPTIVIHLAAIVDAFSTNREGKDLECMAVNYESSVKIAEICKRNNVKIFIYQSSVSIYSKGKDLNEDSQIEPISTYGKAKYLAEREILKLNDNFFKVSCLRPATVIGYNPCFRYETIVNLICIRSVYNIPISIFESALTGEKSYLDVKDNAKGIIFCIENIEKMNGQSFNISSFNVNLKTVLEIVREKLRKEPICNTIPEKTINQQVYTINSDKIKNFGFAPEGEIKEIIKNTILQLEKDKLLKERMT